jgi:hypothetical protein
MSSRVLLHCATWATALGKWFAYLILVHQCGSTFVWLQRWTPVFVWRVLSVVIASGVGHCWPLGCHPKRRSPILSSNGCLPGVGEKLGASVVWRLGGGLLEIPRLPPCVGVAPLGLELGVFNRSRADGSLRARLKTPFVLFPNQSHGPTANRFVLSCFSEQYKFTIISYRGFSGRDGDPTTKICRGTVTPRTSLFLISRRR